MNISPLEHAAYLDMLPTGTEATDYIERVSEADIPNQDQPGGQSLGIVPHEHVGDDTNAESDEADEVQLPASSPQETGLPAASGLGSVALIKPVVGENPRSEQIPQPPKRIPEPEIESVSEPIATTEIEEVPVAATGGGGEPPEPPEPPLSSEMPSEDEPDGPEDNNETIPTEWPPRQNVKSSRNFLDLSLHDAVKDTVTPEKEHVAQLLPTEAAAESSEPATETINESPEPPEAQRQETPPWQHREITVPHTEADPVLTDQAITLLQEKELSDFAPVAVGRPDRNYYVDDPEAPSFFVKVRPQPTLAQYEQNTIATPKDREDTMRTLDRYRNLNELSTWDSVDDVASLPEVQQLATEHGFSSVSVVPPLAAATDQFTGETIVVYPWIDGQALVDAQGEPIVPELHDAVADVLDEVTRLLGVHDIDPLDFSAGNVLIETDPWGLRHIRIIDLEAFAFKR